MVKQKVWRFIFLIVPLVLAILLLIYIKTSQGMKATSEFMSPIENTTIITSLFVFVFGYMCFLILMFFDDIKSFFKAAK